MSDLISRQAAINALNKLDVSDGVGISSIACGVQESAIIAIQHLPAAQPDVIRCKDCVFKYFNEIEYDYFCGRFGMRILQQIDDNCFCSWAERRTNETN